MYYFISIAIDYQFLCLCIQNPHNTMILTSVLRTERGGKLHNTINTIDRLVEIESQSLMCLYAASEAVSNCDILCDVLRFVLCLDKGDNQIVAAACVIEMAHQSGIVSTTINNWSICDVTTNSCGHQSFGKQQHNCMCSQHT